jgi:hypothetical protein
MTSTAILALLLGITASAYAQQEQPGEAQDHHGQQQGKHEQTKPEQNAQQADREQRQPERAPQQPQSDRDRQQQQRAQQQPQSDRDRQQPQRAQEQPQSDRDVQQQQKAQQERGHGQSGRTQEQQRVRQSAWRQDRARSWQSDHRTWQQRGGYNGYRIPDDRFRGYFGPQHGFLIYGLPFLLVDRYPRFQYNGYWFSVVDPWPEYWAADWYDTDRVYVAYVDNGYYLFNSRYPDFGLAVIVLG